VLPAQPVAVYDGILPGDQDHRMVRILPAPVLLPGVIRLLAVLEEAGVSPSPGVDLGDRLMAGGVHKPLKFGNGRLVPRQQKVIDLHFVNRRLSPLQG
jgi:hypothetical protein